MAYESRKARGPEMVIDETNDIRYCRHTSAPKKELERQLRKLYDDAPACCVVSSGVHAVTSAVKYYLKSFKAKHPGESVTLIYTNELYCDTPRFLKKVGKKCARVEVINVDQAAEDMARIRVEGPALLVVESSSNPRSVPFPWLELEGLRDRCPHLSVICDNTWLTHLACNPFDFGAHCVVLSLTKYYGGGKAILGAVLGSGTAVNAIVEREKLLGHHVSPYNCDLVLKALPSMPQRVNAARYVCDQLKATLEIIALKHPVTNICSARLEDYPNDGDYAPSVLTFCLPKPEGHRGYFRLEEACDVANLVLHTSFGGSYTRVDPYPRVQKGGTVRIRVAAGYDDAEPECVQNLCEDLCRFVEFFATGDEGDDDDAKKSE